MPCLVSTLFVQVSLGGYNHKLRILLETVLEQIAKFEVKPERFFVIKVLTKAYQTTREVQPKDLLELGIMFSCFRLSGKVNQKLPKLQV